MPTTYSESPSFSLKTGEYSKRSRNWTNTSNYQNVPRADLPINSYNDSSVKPKQLPRGQSGYSQGGAFTVISGPGFLFDGNQIVALSNSVRVESGYVSAVSRYQDELVAKCLSEIADQKVNLAVALAEGRKTADLILGTAKRLSRAFLSFKRGRLRDVARELNISPRRAHKSWLEYKYGWMPLLMDVKGAAELYAQQHVGRPIRFTVQGKRVVPFNWTATRSYNRYGGGTAHYTESFIGNYTVRVKMWLEITNPNTSTLQQLGLTNPALVAWELVPFSFVFDWFLSVGDYLKGLTALHGVTVRRAMRSNINDLRYDYNQPSTTVQSGSFTYFNDQFICSAEHREYARSALVVDPLSVSITNNFAKLSENHENGTFVKLGTALALLRAVHR